MFLNRQTTPPTHSITIAVLPFRSAADSLEDSNTALNLTEEVITDCKRSTAMHVIDQSIVMPFRNSVTTPQEIARLLHSDKVLSGTASRSGNGIHVAAQLIDSNSGNAVWSRQFEGKQHGFAREREANSKLDRI
jgi:adenylate cyclase